MLSYSVDGDVSESASAVVEVQHLWRVSVHKSTRVPMHTPMHMPMRMPMYVSVHMSVHTQAGLGRFVFLVMVWSAIRSAVVGHK